MANPDLMDESVRKKLIDEIKSSENNARKREEQRKFDIYRKRQAPYVIERLTDEFDAQAVKDMRKILSINPAKRIVDEQASLYVDEPKRHFSDASPEEQDQLDELYKVSRVNPQMRLANRYFKLHGQSCLYVLPKDGKIVVRALTPKDYDVIPDEDDPEKAFAYVLSVWDVQLHKSAPGPTSQSMSAPAYNANDRNNQLIADKNDDKRSKERFVFWTDELHFTTDGNGLLIGEGKVDEATGAILPAIENHELGRLPFVDIANEKDFSFFVQLGSDVTEFVLDFLAQLCDLANTCRFQNYSQAIIYSVDQPKNIKVGPNRIIWLKVDPNADSGTRPEFTFQSPTPDIMGSLEFLNVQLKMFLSSCGLNPGTVSGKNELEKFTSGVDHLLSNLDKFKASKEDMDIFLRAEQEAFELIRKWHEIMFDVTDDSALDEDLRATRIGEQIKMDISYKEPQSVMTQSEIEDSVIKKMKAGLMTKHEAIKQVYGVDDDKADEMLAEIEAEGAANAAMGLGPDGQPLPVELDEDGNPIEQEVDEDGNPIAPAPEMGPDGKPLPPKDGAKPLPFGKKKPKPGEEPEAGADPKGKKAKGKKAPPPFAKKKAAVK